MDKQIKISRRAMMLGSLGLLIGGNSLGQQPNFKPKMSTSITEGYKPKPVSSELDLTFDTYIFGGEWLADNPDVVKSAEEPHKRLLSKGMQSYVLLDFVSPRFDSEDLTRININRDGKVLGENLKKSDFPLVLKRKSGKVNFKFSAKSPLYNTPETGVDIQFLDDKELFNLALATEKPTPIPNFTVQAKYYEYGFFPRILTVYSRQSNARLSYHVHGLEATIGVKKDEMAEFWRAKHLFGNDYSKFSKYLQEHQSAPSKSNSDVK